MAVKKQRSSPYPGITLEAAIERAKTFYKAEGKHEALVSTAVSHWKFSPKSSGGLVAVAALKAYGLLEDKGSGADRKVYLTPRGLSIVQDERIVSPDRDAAIRTAALSPKILSDLWAKYGLNRPSDDTVGHFLRVEREYTSTASVEILKIYEAAIKFAKLDAEDSESSVEEPSLEGDVATVEAVAVASPHVEPPHRKSVALAQEAPARSAGAYDGEEIANVRVSRSTTIRLIASGPYSRQSIEALVAQLKLGLELGSYDDLEDGDVS
ncbi:hypothetical protein [Pseudomonas sp. BF-RE-26]|uniref:hypothetical protein n=1 Tax=Pseudomonas sp. BF-RE-26 TaxID=2832396 RepID=UPI001CBFE0B5|nr:hypothetical protein [Pseudomonas sp. BF-RE-26]